ncbi:MAG: hypothetical protein H6978_00535 [Gammaproteobacteria bacterium]|nr:hypothetical protein [Gammaproteobacteria bacterium]
MDNLLLFETTHFYAIQARDYRVPGYVIIYSKSECDSLAGFDAGQGAELMQCLVLAERIVQQLLTPERIYILKFGEALPRIHFHVVPRTARIGLAFEQQSSNQPPYNGARLVDWLWQQHASLGYGDEELTDFIKQAREVAQQSGLGNTG